MVLRLATAWFLILSVLMISSGMVRASEKSQAQEVINVYTYHDKPPYLLQDLNENIQSGIYLKLVSLLNELNPGQRFRLSYLPRIRLESLLKAGKLNGIVIGVNPIWFGDKKKTKYVWSEAFMDDKDIFLVNHESDLDYRDPSDLIGYTIALERGTYYKGITELIKLDQIKLAATNNSQQNLDMLSYHRADITIMSQLTADYFFSHGYAKNKFKVLKKEHDQFQRSILIPKSLSHLLTAINKSLLILKHNKHKNWLIDIESRLVDSDK
jgi:polar amino acid transport system substrate-binding protein